MKKNEKQQATLDQVIDRQVLLAEIAVAKKNGELNSDLGDMTAEELLDSALVRAADELPDSPVEAQLSFDCSYEPGPSLIGRVVLVGGVVGQLGWWLDEDDDDADPWDALYEWRQSRRQSE